MQEDVPVTANVLPDRAAARTTRASPVSRSLTVSLLGPLLLAMMGFAPVPSVSGAPSSTAVPLTAPSPAWYTPELHREVVEAGVRGEAVSLPPTARVPASALAFTGIRPGAWMVSPSLCTLNFVFGSRTGDRFIGTAGHCADVGDPVTVVTAPGVLMDIGTVVRSVDGGVGDDFALIDVRPAMEAHVTPSAALLGGPIGTGDARVDDVVLHAGHGLVVGTGGTPRAGVVTARRPTASGDGFAWLGAATPGDSGSFVLDVDGRAVGVLTHVIAGGPWSPGTVAGTSVQRMVQLAGRPLVTASRLPATAT